MSEQLPAVIEPGALIAPADTYADTYIVPALIAAAGEQAGWRYLEFFAANINNDHTRRASLRACGRFFGYAQRDSRDAIPSTRPSRRQRMGAPWRWTFGPVG